MYIHFLISGINDTSLVLTLYSTISFKEKCWVSSLEMCNFKTNLLGLTCEHFKEFLKSERNAI